MLNIYQQVLSDIWHIFNGKFSLYCFKISEIIQYAQNVNNTHYIREERIMVLGAKTGVGKYQTKDTYRIK